MLLRREEKMNLFDLANLLDNDGNLQNEMMVMAFAATLLSTIPGTCTYYVLSTAGRGRMCQYGTGLTKKRGPQIA